MPKYETQSGVLMEATLQSEARLAQKYSKELDDPYRTSSGYKPRPYPYDITGKKPISLAALRKLAYAAAKSEAGPEGKANASLSVVISPITEEWHRFYHDEIKRAVLGRDEDDQWVAVYVRYDVDGSKETGGAPSSLRAALQGKGYLMYHRAAAGRNEAIAVRLTRPFRGRAIRTKPVPVALSPWR